MRIDRHGGPRGRVLILVILALLATACGGSGGASGDGASGDGASEGGAPEGGGEASANPDVSAEGVDDGTTLQLWTRAPLELQANLLVEAYNETHENQVELTITPNDDYVTRVGGAAGSGDLPDLFAADIVYVPNWTQAGLFIDLTDRIESLPYADSITEGHLTAGTYEGSQYILPFVLDLSVMFWNKDLYREAGLDPEQGPTTLEEFAEHAMAIQELDREGVYGTYFGGNCGGCGVFTWFPMIWGAGEQVMNEEGTEAFLASDTAQEVYDTWEELWNAGAVGPSSRDETGPTWVAPFQEGNIGVMPYPATLLSTASETVDVGVAPIPGVGGGEATFVGGDGIGISRDSENVEQAWNFLQWLMSEEAQVEVLAANDTTPSRSDLADNEYAQEDPRVLTINRVAAAENSTTPLAVNFQQAFNAPDSPWVRLFRDQIFEGLDNAEELNEEITAVLQP
jgi:multiple sugar transport system substrate-binding protein